MATQADYTHQILLGLDAKAKMKLARTTAKARARAEFETQIKAREKDLFAEAEAEFAGVVKKLHDSGVPGVVIRKDILGTNDWATWTRWRDLAGVEPETQVLERLRVEAVSNQKPYRIEDGVIYVTRNATGPLDEEITIETVSDATGPVMFFPDIGDREQMDRMRTAFPGAKYVTDMSAFLVGAFEKYGDDVNEYIENPSWGGEDD